MGALVRYGKAAGCAYQAVSAVRAPLHYLRLFSFIHHHPLLLFPSCRCARSCEARAIVCAMVMGLAGERASDEALARSGARASSKADVCVQQGSGEASGGSLRGGRWQSVGVSMREVVQNFCKSFVTTVGVLSYIPRPP